MDKYPEFIERNEEGFKFKIRFLNFSENLKDVFSISEGTPGLASLIEFYQEYMKPFKGAGKKKTVIMIVDNDDGAKDIKGKLQDKDFSKPFIHHLENLYIVPVPFAEGSKKAAIEDLLTPEQLLRISGDDTTENPGIDANNRLIWGQVFLWPEADGDWRILWDDSQVFEKCDDYRKFKTAWQSYDKIKTETTFRG